MVLTSLEPGLQDSLTDVVTKSLRKVANQNTSYIEDIDDTVLI